MMEKQQTVVNASEPDNDFEDGSKTSSEDVAPPNGMGAGTVTDEPEAEDTENIEDIDQQKHHDNI